MIVTEINVITKEKTIRPLTNAEKDEFEKNKPTAEDKLNHLKSERNMLLKETDWMANSDVTMSDDWKNYRQALRDITNTYQSMEDEGFAFPTKPTE